MQVLLSLYQNAILNLKLSNTFEQNDQRFFFKHDFLFKLPVVLAKILKFCTMLHESLQGFIIKFKYCN